MKKYREKEEEKEKKKKEECIGSKGDKHKEICRTMQILKGEVI